MTENSETNNVFEKHPPQKISVSSSQAAKIGSQ